MAKPAPSASPFGAATTRAIVAGIGCRRGAAAAEIIALIEAAFAAAGQSPSLLIALASLDRKSVEPGLLAAAAYFGVPLKTFSAGALTASCASVSTKIQALVGASSVAEAAALRAGTLLTPKLKSAHATCALAATGPDFDLASFGQTAPGNTPASTASMAASRSLTSNAGP
ncbi:MAG: cobalamin biosynthesis protein CbiG / cobalt-precorrin-3b C17-methyltransferase [Devosia sp.]|uniref:cobalamin biosynthesis protein n=1 Tax=Devosia sp. TaxID=1871048 RepID=UPI002625E74A|nr:cobalamin biosynthesis protein [Devosia sp.]MDB5535387.1 cobalamin biosynthesis protein CbiG / cobalt-precorrin-3b C17-methyltransferase [Devosia sp.]MDB5589118.1 cobalamin biosynthesis protein CbiG / cobalt-precorrin-3b C17-methyltransferase [Devosia sp.]